MNTKMKTTFTFNGGYAKSFYTTIDSETSTKEKSKYLESMKTLIGLKIGKDEVFIIEAYDSSYLHLVNMKDVIMISFEFMEIEE